MIKAAENAVESLVELVMQQEQLIALLEAERDSLRKSVDQLADTLKNVHEAVCETLGIEGDDALPELVADWAEGEYAALRADRRAFAIKVGHEITSWIDANDPMPDVERIVDAIAAKEPKGPEHAHDWRFSLQDHVYKCDCGATRGDYPFGAASFKD